MDLFGTGYTLLAFNETNVDEFVSAANEVGMPLSVEHIADGKIALLYEVNLVIVRPDGHVAWRGNKVPDDVLSIVNLLRGVV